MASNSTVSNLKRGRGRPIGSKDKVPRASRKLKAAAAPPADVPRPSGGVTATGENCLVSVAAAASAGAVTTFRVPRDIPAVAVVENKPPVKCSWKEVSMTLSPAHEFLVFVTVPGLMKLRLPDAFAKAYARYDPGYALLREASPKQEPWKVSTVWEHGSLYLAGDWGMFAALYGLQSGNVLSFRHREDTASFVVKVFNNEACRVSFLPLLD
jgi:hypothetical protein